MDKDGNPLTGSREGAIELSGVAATDARAALEEELRALRQAPP